MNPHINHRIIYSDYEGYSPQVPLALGVALLGLRITFEQIDHFGWQPFSLVFVLFLVTIFASVFLAHNHHKPIA